ncbi:MAG: hypothetical protein V6Z78_02610 [Holosporaceae bacterium]
MTKTDTHRISQALLCSAFLVAASWGAQAIDFRSPNTDCSVESHALPSAPVAGEATVSAASMFEANITDHKVPTAQPALCVSYRLFKDQLTIEKLAFHETTKRHLPLMYTFLEHYARVYKIDAVVSSDLQDREIFTNVTAQKLLEHVGFEPQGDKLKLVRQALPWLPQPK